MDCHRLPALLLPLSLALPARAQSQPAKPKKPPTKPPAAAPKEPDPPAPKSDVPSRITPTFAALHVAADELPKDWKVEEKLACVSPQAGSLFEDDIYSQILPKPKKQDFQTFAGPKTKGSIIYYDWGDKIPEAAEEFIPAFLFGDEEKPTPQHPEQIIRIGGWMVIVSFPLGSEERNWVIHRLRARFGVRTAHTFGPLKDAILTLSKSYGKDGDHKAGLDFATAHAEELKDSSFAAFLEGAIAAQEEQWERAEKAYGRALALDAANDPLDTARVAWAARDGHGTALYQIKRYDDALRELTAAAAEAAALKSPKDQARSLYNAACCLALLKKSDEAIATLKRLLELDPTWKAHAAEDEDFTALRERPDFKALVK